MDVLAALLDGPRSRGAFLLRMILAPPWSMRVEDEAPLSLLAMVSGTACVVAGAPGSEPLWLHPGDVLLARGPDHYVIGDSPETSPQVVIHPGQRCTTLDGDDLAESMGLGVRTWGNGLDGPTTILLGTYGAPGEIGRRILTALPPLVSLSEESWDDHLIPMLREEIVKDAPGQGAVLDRLIDLVLMSVLRAWFARDEAGTPAWYRAQADPVVGRALRLLHNNPAHPWTLEELARETYVSRALLARRFKELVGEPPMTYLTNWRLGRAVDLLEAPGATIANVADQLGYSSPFALSTAFKRVHGLSPTHHRQQATRAAS
jgi:AraC-like DNA-binding protein